jgi:opacity protein-like surface antigen
MKKVLLLATSVFALAATLSFGQATQARVRVVHASPDAPAVDILVNNGKVLENLPYREYSEYLPLPAGAYEFKINVTGTDTTVKTVPATLMAGRDYTVVAVGYAGGKAPGFDVKLLEDDNTLPANNGVKIRVMHGAPGAPQVDVYLTTPFETLMGKTAQLTNVPFNAASGYLTVPVGLYQARVAVAGTTTVAIDSHRLTTWANMVRTIIAVDNPGGGAPFGFIILPDRN